jgi:hypothetical protein
MSAATIAEDRIEIREYLDMTVNIDHDVVEALEGNFYS